MQPGAERWSLLDALRGLAALTVVFWHWGHFWFEGAPVDGFNRTMFPLYALLAPLYDYGWIAVDMFFVLSGFIFFWKYEAAIGRRSIGPWRFALLRIARLYPLQILTLILVAGLQAVYRAQFGHAFVYANNDGYHFLLNLFMASAWGLQQGFSFNGPSWSISIEVVLYAIFFAAASARLTQSWLMVLVCVVAALACTEEEAVLARGVAGFFAGGLAFRAVRHARESGNAVPACAAACALLLTGALAMAANGQNEANLIRSAALLAFPSAVFLLAMAERRLDVRHLGWLGDISYSSYLLHVPLQLIASYAVVRAFGQAGTAVFLRPEMLIAFLAALIALAFMTNRLFERPAQRLILGLSAAPPIDSRQTMPRPGRRAA